MLSRLLLSLDLGMSATFNWIRRCFRPMIVAAVPPSSPLLLYASNYH